MLADHSHPICLLGKIPRGLLTSSLEGHVSLVAAKEGRGDSWDVQESGSGRARGTRMATHELPRA